MSDRDRGTDRDENLLADLQQRFATIAGDDRQIDPDELQTALRIKDPYYARKVFAIFDADGSGMVSSSEFLTAVEALIHGGQEAKLGFVFQLHDDDHSGLISREELRTIFDASLNEHQLRFASEDIEALVTALFEETDINADGQISLDEFKTTVERYPQICRHMTLSAATWLQPPEAQQPAPSARSTLTERLRLTRHYLQNNWTKLLFLAVYAGVNIWLFANAVQKYAATGANVYVQLARGCGACLNFNGALILIPMLRQWLTWLRQTAVNNVLPLDQSIEFHKLVGHIMFGLSLVHTGAHVLNYTTLSVPFTSSLFGTKAGLTGFFLLLVFIVMWVCALDRIRRQGHFELFYITHWGFVAWFALALVHGPVFWQWTILPIIGYAIERLLRFGKGYEPTYVSNVNLLPSRVTHLEMNRPASFQYRAGEYLFVRCPAISRFEWHPFTITSCPEERDTLSLHVRGLGNWTNALYGLFAERQTEAEDASGQTDDLRIPVYLDGPYGAPAEHIFASKYAILVGAGIGVTPFAAILKSLLYRYRESDTHGTSLQKVHFYWINKTQRSFEWFTQMLAEAEQADQGHLLDINIYMTGSQQDMTSSTLNIAMDLLHEKTSIDLITGLRARTQMGRPNWDEIFTNVAEEHAPEKADVFFCGPPGLAKPLKALSARYGFGFRKENF